MCADKGAPGWRPETPAAVRLTEIEPANLSHWLLRADVAHWRGDAADESCSLQQAGQAVRLNRRYHEAIARFYRFGRSLDSSHSNREATLLAFGMGAAIPIPSYRHLTATCGAREGAARPPAHVTAACLRIARTLATRPDTPIDLPIGRRMLTSIAQSKPDQQLAAEADARLQRLQSAQPALAPGAGRHCADSGESDASLEAWLNDAIRSGEVAAIERGIAREPGKRASASGESPTPATTRSTTAAR
jgi:hypothetical protein